MDTLSTGPWCCRLHAIVQDHTHEIEVLNRERKLNQVCCSACLVCLAHVTNPVEHVDFASVFFSQIIALPFVLLKALPLLSHPFIFSRQSLFHSSSQLCLQFFWRVALKVSCMIICV